jgi:hypothetical protein
MRIRCIGDAEICINDNLHRLSLRDNEHLRSLNTKDPARFNTTPQYSNRPHAKLAHHILSATGKSPLNPQQVLPQKLATNRHSKCTHPPQPSSPYTPCLAYPTPCTHFYLSFPPLISRPTRHFPMRIAFPHFPKSTHCDHPASTPLTPLPKKTTNSSPQHPLPLLAPTNLLPRAHCSTPL